MMRSNILVKLLIIFLAPFVSIAAPSEKIPMRDFFKNPEYSDFQVSRNAVYIAYLKPWNARMNLFIQKLSSKRLPEGPEQQVTFVKDRDIAGYFWKGDDTLLYSRDFGGDENYHVFAVDIPSTKEKDLTPFANVRAGVIDDLANVSPTDVLIQTNQINPEVFDVYRLNTKTGETTLIAKNPGKTDGWVTDHNGDVRVAIESDGLITRIFSRPTGSGEFKKILEYDYKSDFSPLFFTPDNKQLYASSNLTRDKSAIVKIDPQTGKELAVLFSHPDVDVSSLSYSEHRKVITAASYVTWKQEFHFFDNIAKARFAKLKKQLGDSQIYINSLNEPEDLFTVVVTDDKTAARYYLYDDKKDVLTLLYDSSTIIPREKLASVKPVTYKSRDGLTIHGYLTLPVGSEGKNLPVIVNPHGGPWVRDVWGYDPEAQFLANRGFAVFQMNYRGSTGYGKTFFEKSFKQWGKTMQDDITDGVKWLVDQGIADPKRIGIYGGSYGGYATLAGITFTPDLYACAVDYVGVSNLLTFMNTIPPYWKPFLTKLKAMVGDPIKDKALLEAVSPVFHTDRIKTPLFVAQGAKDPRVNIDESNQIVNSLRKRGVEVQYMVKEDEGHGFHNEENRFEFYEAMEKFFQEHLH